MSLQPFASMPGPALRFLVGELPTFRKETPWGACASYAERFGGLARIKVLGRNAVVVNDPALIGDVLVRRPDDFFKDRPRNALLPIGTDASVFTSPGGPHWQQRHDASPFSHAQFGRWLAGQGTTMGPQILRGLRALGTRHENAWDALLAVAFDTVSVALVGRTLEPQAMRDFLALEAVGSRRLAWPLPVFPPLPSSFMATRARWFGAFEAQVQRARKEGAPGSLVGFMLEHGGHASDHDMALELANTYFGGCFSSTTAVLTTLYFLSRDAAARAEVVDAVRGLSPSPDAAWDLSALHACIPLERAIREAMRVFPPVPVFARAVKKEAATQLGGYELPAGTGVLMSPWAVHRSDKQWPDALAYKPSRWDAETLRANPYGSDRFFPFGRGPRSCIGEGLAHAYIKLAVATALHHADARLGEGQELDRSLRFAVFAPAGMRLGLGSKA